MHPAMFDGTRRHIRRRRWLARCCRRGAIVSILANPVKIVDGNIKAAARESGEVAKALRAVTGISVRDIQKYGIAGGPEL
jgi:hypothetical protein